MKITIALTGASGNMGRETLSKLFELPFVGKIKILVLNERKERAYARRMASKYGEKLQVILGDIADKITCEKLVDGADYVINLAAVIPPSSDHYPEKTKRCNLIGVENLCDVIEGLAKQPKLIHISTVAVYGFRNYLHPWGRVGDPLLPSVYDVYAEYKVKGERRVLESNLKNWVVLRQTAILHNRMLTNNMKDGLMFHTCFNVPLEWVTSRDSGLLIKNIVKKDVEGDLQGFWKKCFNIGGGADNRCTGYDTFDGGFKIIGGSTEKYMRPTWNSIRNFHGMWFYDSDILQKMFDFQTEDVNDYWQEILAKHPYYKLAKIVPRHLVSKLAIERLLKDENSPRRWVSNKDGGKVKAYFGSNENLDCMPTDWRQYPVLAKGELPDADINYDEMRDITKVKEHGYLLSHGYDESKADGDLDIDDMRAAAEFRGGRCLSENMAKGDLYTPLLWECHDGHVFSARPYTVLKAGHWCPTCCEPEPWDYDRLSKFTPFFAQVWYDTHARGENCTYFYDADYHAKYTRFQQGAL